MKHLSEQLRNFFTQKKGPAHIAVQEQLFDEYFINAKILYMKKFGLVPNIFYVGKLDSTRVFSWLEGGNAGSINSVYQRNYYDWDEHKQVFSRTIFTLSEKLVIELCRDYAHIYYASENASKVSELVDKLVQFEEKVLPGEFEINIISRTRAGLELKELSIDPTHLDIDLYYNNDFKAVDDIIRERLEKEKDKGIILLHGLPGTGKTTYLRHIVGQLKKKVLFMSPNVAGDLMDPDFIDLLIDNPNAVLVIEDAENIIMDRRYSSRSGVSNLLNISDGLLSDCLNVQIICTFNSAINMIDPALLRKGRLIARYEFGKLELEKARKLSAHLGIEQEINSAMTLAEIANPAGYKDVLPKVEVIGFRQQLMEN